jgi:hypothetical protein
MLQIVALLTIIIYDRNSFIIQATENGATIWSVTLGAYN